MLGQDKSLSRETTSGAGGVLTAPEVLVLPEVDREEESFLEIRDRRSRRIVTIIELLSPSNKRPGKDRDQYIWKRERILASETSLVEIDLLRGHPRMPYLDAVESDYCILVSRQADRPRASFWRFGLRDPIPLIAVPLDAGKSDVRLDCQAILHYLYDRTGLGKLLYDEEPDPPLSTEDAAWARSLIPARFQAGP